jgi:hypothetical protein
MERREFIKMGMTGLAYITASMAAGGIASKNAFAGIGIVIDFTMEEVMFEMVDKRPVYHWAFKDSILGFRIPAPVIVAVEGDLLQIRVTNRLPGGVHSFAIPGIVDSGVIPFGQTREALFSAPPAGTYMYLDPLDAPKNRVMGLHGVLVVLPLTGNAPYSNPTPAVQNLFDHLGTADWSPGRGSAHFPGHPWDPDRHFIWVFETVDSVKNAAVRANPNMTGAQFQSGYLPDYFLISGKSGFFLSHDENIGPHGNVGQPAIIRAINAGMSDQSPHIHGNHVYVLSENNALEQRNLPTPHPANGHVHDNVILLDVWTLSPGDRKDVLLPFIRPPDIPDDRDVDFNSAPLDLAERVGRGGSEKAWPPIEEPFPISYPMHDHNELSQTAAHGNYPQGAVLHFNIEGDIDMEIIEDVRGANRRQVVGVVPGKDGVILVDSVVFTRATRRLDVLGRYSGNRGDTLSLFAGNDFTGPFLGQATVFFNGTWGFNRTFPRIPSQFRTVRTISIRNENNGAERMAIRFKML